MCEKCKGKLSTSRLKGELELCQRVFSDGNCCWGVCNLCGGPFILHKLLTGKTIHEDIGVVRMRLLSEKDKEGVAIMNGVATTDKIASSLNVNNINDVIKFQQVVIDDLMKRMKMIIDTSIQPINTYHYVDVGILEKVTELKKIMGMTWGDIMMCAIERMEEIKEQYLDDHDGEKV